MKSRSGRFFAEMLISTGYEIVEAEGGKQALDVFGRSHESIDCVLLDFSMPDMDGLEVLSGLRKLDPGIKVILTSGFAEKKLSDEFKGAGFSGVIQKPARLDTLTSKIAEVLREGNVREEG